MKKWIKENGGPLIVAAALVGIAVGGLTYLDKISDGISENRNEIRVIREELGNDIKEVETGLRSEIQDAETGLRSEQRETREELRSEIRNNRNSIDVFRVEMNDGFVRVNDRVEEYEEDATRRIDAANGRIDDVNGLNVDTNRRIDDLSGEINSRNDPADSDSTSDGDVSGG